MRGALTVMPASDLVNLSGLMDDAKCFALVRQHRWPEGVRWPTCDGGAVIRVARQSRTDHVLPHPKMLPSVRPLPQLHAPVASSAAVEPSPAMPAADVGSCRGIGGDLTV